MGAARADDEDDGFDGCHFRVDAPVAAEAVAQLVAGEVAGVPIDDDAQLVEPVAVALEAGVSDGERPAPVDGVAQPLGGGVRRVEPLRPGVQFGAGNVERCHQQG